jgi:hypothetical protein
MIVQNTEKIRAKGTYIDPIMLMIKRVDAFWILEDDGIHEDVTDKRYLELIETVQENQAK